MCYFPWQRRIKVIEKIKFANQITLKLRGYPSFGKVNVISRVLTNERQGKKREKEMAVWDGLGPKLQALKVKKASHKPRMQAAYRNWERQGNTFSCRPSKRKATCWHLDMSPVEIHFGLRNCKLINVVTDYNRNRKSIIQHLTTCKEKNRTSLLWYSCKDAQPTSNMKKNQTNSHWRWFYKITSLCSTKIATS